jgi:hypothetical protein
MEQFCLLAQSQKGRACAALIEQVWENFIMLKILSKLLSLGVK